jgi:putative phage-type endonuclease
MGGTSQRARETNDMAAGRGAVTAFDGCEWTGVSAGDREAWLTARRQGVGGSDAAAIMGVDDWRSELAVYAEKVASGPPTDEASEIADWGRIFEPAIIKEYARRSRRRVVRGGHLMRSKRASHHLITLDGVQLSRAPAGARGPGVAEVKTTGYGDRYSDDLPVEVQVQIQWELWVTGAAWATCIWLPFPERRMQWIDVLPHRAFQEVLAERVDNFWTRVQLRQPPNPDGSESSELALRRLWPDSTGEVIRIVGATALADEYERNKAALELLKTRQLLIKNTLAATIREAKYAVLDDGRYWGTAFYAARDNRCKHCSEVLSSQGSYRTYTLREPKKKNPHIPTSTRQLVADLGAEQLHSDELVKQLEASVAANVDQPNTERGAA